MIQQAVHQVNQRCTLHLETEDGQPASNLSRWKATATIGDRKSPSFALLLLFNRPIRVHREIKGSG
jgi:hypothetical protein